MFGHQYAFRQCGVITNEQSFNRCFADRLYQTKGASGASGWASAIEDVAISMDKDPEVVFAELSGEFLSQWPTKA
jgi:hypothetical protein